MILAAEICLCCVRARWTGTCARDRKLPNDAPMTTMTDDEWQRTRSLRRDLVRMVGLLRWWEMTIEACDAAVRDAEVRGTETVAREVMGR
jgi:hypothetical protein